MKKAPMIRTSISVRKDILAALDVIKKVERVPKNSQVEMGLNWYLLKHRPLLQEHGIDLWKEN